MSATTPGPAGGSYAPIPSPARRRPIGFVVFCGAVLLSTVLAGVTVAVARSGLDKPVDVVRDYLQAVADADAARALSFTSSVPSDQTLLTDAVLASSRQQAPIHDIVVTADPSSDERVDVAYRQGDDAVSDSYLLTRVGGRWTIDRVTTEVNFLPVIDSLLPVVVNGTPVQIGGSQVFPGTYTVTTGLKNASWGADPTASYTLNSSTAPPEIIPTVTAAGKTAFLNGAKSIVNGCLKKHALAPSGCPFGLYQPTSGPKVVESSVRWSLKSSPWSRLANPELDSMTDPGYAKARASMTFVVRCRFSTGEECVPQDVTSTVVLAGDLTTEPMKVTFTGY